MCVHAWEKFGSVSSSGYVVKPEERKLNGQSAGKGLLVSLAEV